MSTFTLFPLINESINSLTMVAHCMRVIRRLIQHLNPTQIPVITGDQPVQALMNQKEFGEKHFFVGMWGLHIEMAMLSIYINYVGNLY